jgi:probable DNA repair protein
LVRLHTANQRAAGKAAWRSPFIYDWEGWLGILWKQHLQNAGDTRLLLTPLQEQAIWEQIVGPGIDISESIAALAAGAWRLLSDYNAHGHRRSSWRGAAADALAFRGWADNFERQCNKNRWIGRSDLSAALASAIRELEITPPGEILLIGFDRVTPAQQALLDAVQEANSVVAMEDPTPSIQALRLVVAADLREEIATVALWARRQLDSNPSANIAILVQDIEGVRGEIERTFRATLVPESSGIDSAAEMPFEFSLGLPLSEVPVIKAALLLLRWLIQPIEQTETSWLMTSGFLSARDEEIGELAAFDAQIREYAGFPPQIPLEAFAAYRPRSSSLAGWRFFSRLRVIQNLAVSEKLTQRLRTFPDWIDFASTILKRCSWPGGRALESIEFQARNRWERLIDDIAALGFDRRRVSYSTFASILDRYARVAIFAPESHDAPIQVMGAFESSGQHFDATWFLGMDEGQWPPVGQLHPLLPRDLQRRLEVPHSSGELDWDLALAATHRIAASAPVCVFSHAQRDNAGELRPSPLIRAAFNPRLEAMTSQEFRNDLQLSQQSERRLETESFEDVSSVHWPVEIDAGGAEILKRQSACPFQSFATRRLGAKELRSAERGLSPRDRGIILHKVLELLWAKENPPDMQLATRDHLIQAKTAGHLAHILDAHIERVFDDHARDGWTSRWADDYLRVERMRLHSLLSQWLDLEIQRTPFAVVEHEKDTKAVVNGLRLNLRVDRVDQVSDGHLILDYKSGEVSPAMWECPRPEEPQALLYAVHGQVDDLRGILFAQVRAGAMRFKGRVDNATVTVANNLGAQSDLVKNPLTNDTLTEWVDALNDLAAQFLAGEATVTPRRYPQTCRYCALPALCRVAETPVAFESFDEEELDAENGAPTQRDNAGE